MKKITIKIVLALLCLNFTARCQGNDYNIVALKTGEHVPETTINNIINYKGADSKPATTAKFCNFKGKLLILDFWATWCSNCLEKMPLLDSLQRQFGDKLQILLVNTQSTHDTPSAIERFYQNHLTAGGEKYLLPTVIMDTVLNRLFPHRLLPHYVWISPEGRVIGNTSADEVSRAKITAALNKAMMPLEEKFDQDYARPLFSDSHLPEDKVRSYSILLKGNVTGLSSGYKLRKSGGIVRGLTISNTPLITLFKSAFRELLPNFNFKRIILNVKDTSALVYKGKPSGQKAWDQKNRYTYDLIIPDEKKDSLYGYLLQDLNRYSPFQAKLENRKTSCLVLTLTGSPDRLLTKGGKYENTLYRPAGILRNASLSKLVNRLNDLESVSDLVIDETGFTGMVDLSLNCDFRDLTALKKELLRYNLNLVATTRRLPMWVITDQPNFTASSHP